MKKSVLASLLALATVFPGTVSMVYAQAAAAPGQITIKDPAEYNEYTNAVGQSTPAAKAAAIEAFLTKYPNSVAKTGLLEQLMLAYQGDPTKMLDAADRLLAADPGNLRALATSVYIEKSQAAAKTTPADAQPILDKAAAQAQTGLNATKPADMVDADFQKLKSATAPIFESAIAQDDQNKKDFAGAVAAFTAELKAYPDPAQTQSGPGLNDTYLLGQAYAQQTPPDLKNAVWFFTRAAQFAPPQAKPQIEKAAEYFYNKYHGSMDGYPAIQTLAQANLFPPDSYNPTPAPPPPSPADLASQTVASTPDLKTLSLGDKEFILFNGKPEDAEKVWAVMKGQRVQVPGQIVSATADSVQVAVTEDSKQNNKADFTINMKTPLKTVPSIGTTVTYDATFDSYVANPPMITLTDGEPPAKSTAAHPARRRAAH